MTGARIEAKFDDADFRAGLARLGELTADFRPLLKRIGVGLVATTQERFREAKDPAGGAWAPLNPAYADEKAHGDAKKALRSGQAKAKRGGGALMDDLWSPTFGFKSGAGILRGAAMRGGLMGSITFRVEGRGAVAIGSSKVYAAVHQFGAVIKPKTAKGLRFWLGGKLVVAKSVTIPARPYLGFGEADRLVVREQVDLALFEAVTGGSGG